MNCTKMVVVFAITTLFVTGCEQTLDRALEDSLDRPSDEAAIHALLAANAASANAGDPAGVQATFMSDGDGWIAGMPRISTREGLLEAEAEFENLPGFQSWDLTSESIRFVSQDVAIVEISATTTLDTGQFDEETTIVVARTQMGWKIAAWRVMTFDEILLNMLRE